MYLMLLAFGSSGRSSVAMTMMTSTSIHKPSVKDEVTTTRFSLSEPCGSSSIGEGQSNFGAVAGRSRFRVVIK